MGKQSREGCKKNLAKRMVGLCRHCTEERDVEAGKERRKGEQIDGFSSTKKKRKVDRQLALAPQNEHTGSSNFTKEK